MIITSEQKLIIENIIKECHGYKGNEHLLEAFFDEVVRKADALISNQKDINNIKVYLKRIANVAILEVSKRPASYTYMAPSKDFFEEIPDKQSFLEESQIYIIENTLNTLAENDDSGLYKKIFKFRYLDGLKNNEIAHNLDIEESEVNKKLLFILNNLSQKI